MGSVATILLWGYLYGLLNIKWLYALGYLFFTVGSAVCAGTPNMNGEICGRVIAGLSPHCDCFRQVVHGSLAS